MGCLPRVRMNRTPLDMDRQAWAFVNRIARANFWRVASWYDFDDLAQDGAVIWYRVGRQYPHISDPRHLMSIFKMAYTQHIHDLSKRATRQRELEVAEDDAPELGDDPPRYDPALIELIVHAPASVKAVILAMLEAPGERLRATYRRRMDGTRETTSERLASLADLSMDTPDLVAAIRSYLSR